MHYVCNTCGQKPLTEPVKSLDRRFAKGICHNCKKHNNLFVLVAEEEKAEKKDGK